uniref:Uncharacterized protein n=1 Tax=Knipowitschia caucasica TaxID=637954 RepID=A0AAV2IVY5_KNICA
MLDVVIGKHWRCLESPPPWRMDEPRLQGRTAAPSDRSLHEQCDHRLDTRLTPTHILMKLHFLVSPSNSTDIIVSSSSAASWQPFTQCDSTNDNILEDGISTVNKRHCRTFDSRSLEYPKIHKYTMESPFRKAERHAANPEVAWNALGRQQREKREGIAEDPSGSPMEA